MARGRMIDNCNLDKYIKIIKPDEFPLLSKEAIEGFKELLFISNRDGLIDFSNPYDSGVVYDLTDIAFIC
ncbi:hypothetical protein LLG07_06075, partial [bacterium]|nr:hypothetical protein [bacterium]